MIVSLSSGLASVAYRSERVAGSGEERFIHAYSAFETFDGLM